MRYIIFFLSLLPVTLFAQTKADYEKVMAKFIKFYNHQQSDSIANMWPEKKDMWNDETVKSSLKVCGKIKSFKYLGTDKTDPDNVTVFKVVFSIVGVKALSFTLQNGSYLGTFRFITSSPEIERMLKEDK